MNSIFQSFSCWWESKELAAAWERARKVGVRRGDLMLLAVGGVLSAELSGGCILDLQHAYLRARNLVDAALSAQLQGWAGLLRVGLWSSGGWSGSCLRAHP
jgi:hypothetical protein